MFDWSGLTRKDFAWISLDPSTIVINTAILVSSYGPLYDTAFIENRLLATQSDALHTMFYSTLWQSTPALASEQPAKFHI